MDFIVNSKNLLVCYQFTQKRLNGKQLYVSTLENYEEAKKVKKGAVITVKHLGTNAYGTLQYPKFYRERTDVKWEDLINT
jgi:lauroyl/myristoyl acyltransferase